MTSATLAWVLERLAKGERVALASVVEAKGSVPGKPGARLAMSNIGGRHGTVGGAGLELKVENHLKKMLENGSSTSRIENYILHINPSDLTKKYVKEFINIDYFLI